MVAHSHLLTMVGVEQLMLTLGAGERGSVLKPYMLTSHEASYCFLQLL